MTKMPPTTRYSPGDVVLVRFPFTDLTTTKQRPAVVVSPPGFSAKYGDIVVVAVTGKEGESGLALQDWKQAGLLKARWFKPLIGTLSQSLISKRCGTISNMDRERLSQLIHTMFDSSLRRGGPGSAVPNLGE